MTHLGSRSNNLVELLQVNDRIQFNKSKINFDSYSSLEKLTSIKHKKNDLSAIYGAVLNFNENVSNKFIFNVSKLIYFISNPLVDFSIIENEYGVDGGIRYFCYRLRRIYEIAYYYGGFFLTYNDLLEKKSLNNLEDYLLLKNKLINNTIQTEHEDKNNLNLNQRKYLLDTYEKYFFKLKNLNLNLVN